MQKPTAQLNFRISFELYKKLTHYAEAKKISKTEAVRRAIEKLLAEKEENKNEKSL